jgi:hypothetical protein
MIPIPVARTKALEFGEAVLTGPRGLTFMREVFRHLFCRSGAASRANE